MTNYFGQSDPNDRRVFLGWEKPALKNAAETILSLAEHKQTTPSGAVELDLSTTIAVVPTRRARRVLLSSLVNATESADVHCQWFSPPRILTPSEALGALLPPTREGHREITPIERSLLWREVLASSSSQVRYTLFSRADISLRMIDNASRQIAMLAEEISAADTTFDQTLQMIKHEAPPQHVERWLAATSLANDYNDLLRRNNLVDPQAPASDRTDTIPTFTRAYLVCVCEMVPRLRHSIERIDVAFIPLLFAPIHHAEGFDLLGCLCKEYWIQRNIPLSSSSLVRATDVRSQAHQAVGCLLSCGAKTTSDVAVGVIDTGFTMPLVREAELCSTVPVRSATGSTLRSGPVGQLIFALSILSRTKLCSDMLVFLNQHSTRHWLANELDAYCGEHRINGASTHRCLAEIRRVVSARLPRTVDALLQWSDDLSLPSQYLLRRTVDVVSHFLVQSLTISSDTYNAIYKLIDTLYKDSSTTDATSLLTMIQPMRNLPSPLDTASLPHETLQHLLTHMGIDADSKPASIDAVEAIGWLELWLDPSDHAVILGAHERSLPSMTRSHPWLHDSLCERLGLASRDQRRARDIYLITSLVSSKSSVKIILGITDSAGEPVLPSPLLFHTDENTAVANAHMALDQHPNISLFEHRLRPGDTCHFDTTYPTHFTLPDSIPITSFRTYIRSPHEFFVRYVLRLSETPAVHPEMDSAAFGTFVHRVLQSFGNSDVRHSSSENEIREYLIEALAVATRAQFGSNPRSSVRLQLRSAHHILMLFAAWQAQWRDSGWMVCDTEYRESHAHLRAGNTEVTLSGTIDRVDIHETTGQISIIDYKTSEKPASVERAHRNADGWIDLQLPLYRHLLDTTHRSTIAPNMMYVNLSEAHATELPSVAQWDQSQLEEADTVAVALVNRMRRGLFSDRDALGAASVNALREDVSMIEYGVQ